MSEEGKENKTASVVYLELDWAVMMEKAWNMLLKIGGFHSDAIEDLFMFI